MAPGVISNLVHPTDLHKVIMSTTDKSLRNVSDFNLRNNLRGVRPLVSMKNILSPASTVTNREEKNREIPSPISSTKTKISAVDGNLRRPTGHRGFPRLNNPNAAERAVSKPVRLSYQPPKETSLVTPSNSNSIRRIPKKSTIKQINKPMAFHNIQADQENQIHPFSFMRSKKTHSPVQDPRRKTVSEDVVAHSAPLVKREAHWRPQDPPFYGLRYPPSGRGRHSAESRIVPHQHVHPNYPGYYISGGWGRPQDSTNSTTTEPGGGGTHPYNVVGLLLAAASVIFIIIGIAFVFTRVRRRKPSPNKPATDDVEMVETSKPDPYAQWLNMPEEEPPKPALKKQVKTAVRTVSRKISLTPKPTGEVFTPGVPPHLRYQLKQIYVY